MQAIGDFGAQNGGIIAFFLIVLIALCMFLWLVFDLTRYQR